MLLQQNEQIIAQNITQIKNEKNQTHKLLAAVNLHLNLNEKSVDSMCLKLSAIKEASCNTGDLQSQIEHLKQIISGLQAQINQHAAMKMYLAQQDSAIGESMRAESVLDSLLGWEAPSTNQLKQSTDVAHADCEEGNLHTPKVGPSARKQQSQSKLLIGSKSTTNLMNQLPL